jgi:hypothetical protein
LYLQLVRGVVNAKDDMSADSSHVDFDSVRSPMQRMEKVTDHAARAAPDGPNTGLPKNWVEQLEQYWRRVLEALKARAESTVGAKPSDANSSSLDRRWP